MLLQGFTSDPDTSNSVPVAQALVPCLGNGPTPITTPLEIDDGAARIRYAVLSLVPCSNPLDAWPGGLGQTALLIDNLLYDRPLNPPAGETEPPILTITKPTNGATVLGMSVGSVVADVTATIKETQLANVTVQVNGHAAVPMNFYHVDQQNYFAGATIADTDGLMAGSNALVVTAVDFDRPQHTGSATITFTYQPTAPPPTTQVDFWPTAFEVDQSIDHAPQFVVPRWSLPFVETYRAQQADHPLIAGKYTMIRIYAAASGTTTSTPNVPAIWSVDRIRTDCATGVVPCFLASNMPPLSSAHVLNYRGISVPAFGMADSDPNVASSSLRKSWNFLIPPDWTKDPDGTPNDLHISVTINAGNYSTGVSSPEANECRTHVVGECNDNNSIELVLRFVTPPSITVYPVLIHLTGPYKGANYNDLQPKPEQVDRIFQQLNELYPVRVVRGQTLHIYRKPSISKDDLLDAINAFSDGNGSHLYVGIFPADQAGFDLAANERNPITGVFISGLSWNNDRGAWADANDSMDPAHELGHNIGFEHWGCENGTTNDECGVFPIPHGGIGGVGIDIANWRVIPRGDDSSNRTPHAHDFMSYGQLCDVTDKSGKYIYGGGPGCDLGEWVSWYTYDILLHHFTVDSYDPEDPPALLVRGRIDPSGTVTFRPAYQVDVSHPLGDTIVEDDAKMVYTIQGYDSNGNTVFVHNFEPRKLDVHNADNGKLYGFQEAVPIVPNLQRLAVIKAGKVLGDLRNPSPGRSPTVTIVSPTSGTVWPAGTSQTITWTTVSPAGAALSALVQYSPDGGKTKITLGRDITDTSLTIFADQLAGSTNGVIYVQVSDGLNTATASASPIAVQAKPPTVHIVSPSANTSVQIGVPLTLEGTAFDRQEELADGQFHWSSDKDGPLGTGRELTVTNLTIGRHSLSLSVRDSQGLTGTDTRQIEVVGGTPPSDRYFPQTGFRIDNDTIWDYVTHRGGVATFGYPTSRTFRFQGFTVQFFQRRIVQLDGAGHARLLNLLDPGLLPYTSFNGSTFPQPDSGLTSMAPDPTNQPATLAWVKEHAPDSVGGVPVNFYQTFANTVSAQVAFPSGGDLNLLPGINLEMWGIPTSGPLVDPSNHNFIYLRWQRGIMHYDASCNCTQGILLADYLKSILTGQNLPSDLDQQARSSPFYKQYDKSQPNWVHDFTLLPDTDLTDAFTQVP